MGFPIGYTEHFLPKLLLHTLSILTLLRTLISSLFSFLNLSDFLQPDLIWTHQNPHPTNPTTPIHHHSVSATLIREILPVVKFSDLLDTCTSIDLPETCAVCLYEFEPENEIRRLSNCSHVFHRCCLDKWMDCDQKTCPLCRMSFVPEEMQDDFNERFWAASGIPDLYGEYTSVTGI